MPFFHDQGRSSLRRMYVEAWRKRRESLPVEPVEAQIIGVIELHPEYWQPLESGSEELERDYKPEDGKTNPFLHMGLHLAIREQVSTEEWQARVDLAACYRLTSLYGMTEMVANHISCRVPGTTDQFLINPYGMHFGEITASSLIKIDIDGNKIDVDNPWHVNKAGFVQHSLFHRTLPDAHAIIHTHTTATVAVCSLEGGLQPVNFYACNFMGQLAYHDFEGVTVRAEEGERLLANLVEARRAALPGRPSSGRSQHSAPNLRQLLRHNVPKPGVRGVRMRCIIYGQACKRRNHDENRNHPAPAPPPG